MIKFITVWFLVVTLNQNNSSATSYSIPYATQSICLKQAGKVNRDNWKGSYAECKFGQMPIYVEVK